MLPKLPLYGGRREPLASIVLTWRTLLPLAVTMLFVVLAAACTGQPPAASVSQAVPVSLTVDGQTHNLTTEASNVRELLEEAGITLEPLDEVSPPISTPVTADMSVVVVRVTEEIEIIEESISFERKTVRSDALGVDDPPRIIQGGRNGLQEITVRTVFHDGVEVERQQTRITIIEEPQDEIVMIGVGSAPGAFSFDGLLAYISSGNGVVLRGSTLLPEQLDTGGQLDGRVFSLSPAGDFLLYTRVITPSAGFNNSLWMVSTEPGAEPRELGVENVLWADWNPSRESPMQIAYTTGRPVSQPPGWEANNDLWLSAVFADEDFPFNPQLVVEAYPATYGWWGGNFAWSPTGEYIAYAYADEVGVIDLQPARLDEQRRQLDGFTEYNTRADWVWVPTISWSPDGQFLVYSSHSGTDTDAMSFDVRVASLETGVVLPFAQQAGMWSHPHWSPPLLFPTSGSTASSQIAYLQASNPLDGLRSPYTLCTLDQDGSNASQVYPPVGENSRFPREAQFMAWGPTGQDLAFIFDNSLYFLSLSSQEAFRITRDDSIVSRPTWAPYGAAIPDDLSPTEQTAAGSEAQQPDSSDDAVQTTPSGEAQQAGGDEQTGGDDTASGGSFPDAPVPVEP